MAVRAETGLPINPLSGIFPESTLAKVLVPLENWHPYPTAKDRAAWKKVPEKIRQAQIKLGEQHLNTAWAPLAATAYLGCVRDGTLGGYGGAYSARRQKLADLVIAECMEGRGRFVDDIANGVWAVCEESSWSRPEHLAVKGLPDPDKPDIDLFSAETAMLLAWIDYLLGPELDSVSVQIRRRVRREADIRVLTPGLKRNDYWWIWDKRRRPNNWNPWICSNWLAANLILEDDPARRARSTHKIFRVLDNYLNPHPRDGGCDEGPSYWDLAGGGLFDCLTLLKSVTNGKINLFDQPMVREIGRYIMKAHICGPYYINWADADAKPSRDAVMIFRFGKSVGDKRLAAFGALLAKEDSLFDRAATRSFGTLRRLLPNLFSLNEVRAHPAADFLPADMWLPDIQVAAARDRAGSCTGLYFAAKGGDNNESHNHNCVGNFIIYADGEPVIIDVGRETYNAQTFSDARFHVIWYVKSEYHNCPTVNGPFGKEKYGAQYRATDVRFRADRKKAVFSLDMAQAYSPRAFLKSWKREVRLNREKNIIVTEDYELLEVKDTLKLSLMTCCTPKEEKPGFVRLAAREGKGSVKLAYETDKLALRIEPIEITDERLLQYWGARLYRLLFFGKEMKVKDRLTFVFEQE